MEFRRGARYRLSNVRTGRGPEEVDYSGPFQVYGTPYHNFVYVDTGVVMGLLESEIEKVWILEPVEDRVDSHPV
jgi:hypothetical protein